MGWSGGKGRLVYFCLVWFGPRALLHCPLSFLLSFPEHSIGKETVLERAHAGYFQDKCFQLSAEVRELGRSAPAHRGMLQDLEAWVLSEAAIQAHHEEALPACGFTTCSPSTALLWRLETVAPSLSEVGRSCPSFVHVSLCEALSAATSPRTGPEPQRLRCRVRSRVSLS